MQRDKSARPIRVDLLAVTDSTPSTLFGLYEVLSNTGVVWPTLVGSHEPEDAKFQVRIVSDGRDTFHCSGGIPINPHASIDSSGNADIIIVTDINLPVGMKPTGRWPAVSAWLRRQYDAGAIVCSVCTGSVILADAGLLNDLEATTHWSAKDLFAEFFPAVKLRPDRILVPSGDAHRLITCGGVSSWEDLVLYLIARFCGQNEAIRTAKIYLFGDRSEGQLPYAAASRPKRHQDAVISSIQEWIADNYNGANVVARMVVHSRLPERTFKRRFKVATGYTPIDYIQNLRIEEAKQILETSAAATDAVGRAVGYEDPTFLRRLFKRRTGTTPARYRQRFKSIGRADLN